ncbi:uncharacterized protein TNCV_374231 [Trichonephila clavipes]|nr:uncharacterized protein TNCV_374231 [Trichonephila clavipes]
MQKWSDLSNSQKGAIIEFRAKDVSISKTAKFVKGLRAAAVKVYRAWQNGTVQNQRRDKCGTLRGINDKGKQRLRKYVRANRRAIVQQLTAQMN